MQKITFSDDYADKNSIGILIRTSAFKKAGLNEYYVSPLMQQKIDAANIAAYPLDYPSANVTAKQAKSYLEHLLPYLADDSVDLIYCVDSAYFKQLTGINKKLDAYVGYVVRCVIPGYEYMNVVLGSSYASLFHNPAGQVKITQSLYALAAFANGHYLPPGSTLFDKINLINDFERIKDLLTHLLTLPKITCDIETLSLAFKDAGISTIAFGEDTQVAHSFAVNTHLGLGAPVRRILRIFFENYKGTIIWHNAGYDLKVLVYVLWMKHPLDHAGMLEGIEVMTRNFDDTRLIAYLALNSCNRTSYSLKVLAQEFAGNYAEQDIAECAKIAPADLLRYNCVDALATWYVYDKYYQKMVDDQQLDLYQGLFKDCVALLIEVELTGMPINMDKVKFAKETLEKIRNDNITILESTPIIQSYNKNVQQAACDKKNATLKKKVVTLADFADVKFNPNSGPQLQKLLYEILLLPIIDKTKKKKPATGNKTLSKLKKHTKIPEIVQILDALVNISKTSKILSAFIPAFENAWLKADGCYYLHGSFNLGFVVSGRLSSSDPNLTNLPAGSTYGKLIKDCFSPPKGWLMAGADFASLEDKISGLTTKDPNKLAPYIQGYDGHSLRTYAYYPEQLPDIVDTVESINSIQVKYEDLRGRSKAPTFALTYQGTYITLMKNCGFSEQEAKSIEERYRSMYKVSIDYIDAKLRQASKDGYVTCAFGLRVRTPLLQQVVYGTSSMPFEAAAEGRTAGNALGQSYCMLNVRAAIEMRKRRDASPYRLQLRINCLIHDATYFLIKNDVEVVEWTNNNYVECMEWQQLPEIQHPIVKLGGELDLFHPSWAYKHTLPNGISQQAIIDIANKSKTT
jgi:DNA polymerase-1